MKRRTPLALAVLAALLLVGGCRGDGAGQRRTTGPDLAREAAVSSVQTRTALTAPASTATGGGAVLVLSAQNIRFDKASLTAPAGAITIRFENRDNGIPHDLHLFAGSDATSASIAHTEISTGPTTTTLTVDLGVGTYFYQCDVHPSVMNGLLIVTGPGPTTDETPQP